MGVLTTLGKGQGYLKAGFLGFQKSGKTWTSTLLAIGVRDYFKLEGPIAMYDTENGSEYVAEMVEKATGKELQGLKSRSFSDLVDFGKECLSKKVSVAIVDSVTHPWRELCKSFLVQLNEKRREKKLYPLQKLEFQHWDAVKTIWSEWTDFYMNAPLHIIIAGRAGYEYEMELNDETGRKELTKTGIKMKTEGEFGFEPRLLVEMEREQVPDEDGRFHIRRLATILGDCFGVIDGKSCYDPTFKFFLPHVQKLTPGAHSTVDVDRRTDTGVDEQGDDGYARERKTRTILSEEIEGELVAAYPGMTAEEKKTKKELIYEVFGTRSWTAVENMDSDKLREGLAKIRSLLHKTDQAASPSASSHESTSADKTPEAEGSPLRTLTDDEWLEIQDLVNCPEFDKDRDKVLDYFHQPLSPEQIGAAHKRIVERVSAWRQRDTAPEQGDLSLPETGKPKGKAGHAV